MNTEGTYSKEEVAQILGLSDQEFQNFIISDLSLYIKDSYLFTELVLLKNLKKIYDRKNLPKKIIIYSLATSFILSLLVGIFSAIFINFGDTIFNFFIEFLNTKMTFTVFGETYIIKIFQIVPGNRFQLYLTIAFVGIILAPFIILLVYFSDYLETKVSKFFNIDKQNK